MHFDDRFICPVCGYDQLDEAPYDNMGCASFDICPCCGTQYGYHDANTSYLVLRKKWIANGMQWWSDSAEKPKHWDPVKQLKNIV